IGGWGQTAVAAVLFQAILQSLVLLTQLFYLLRKLTTSSQSVWDFASSSWRLAIVSCKLSICICCKRMVSCCSLTRSSCVLIGSSLPDTSPLSQAFSSHASCFLFSPQSIKSNDLPICSLWQ